MHEDCVFYGVNELDKSFLLSKKRKKSRLLEVVSVDNNDPLPVSYLILFRNNTLIS